MARRRPAEAPPAPESLQDGPIAKALGRLRSNRLTDYQDLCLRLGGLAVDLPIGRFHGVHHRPGMLFRHTSDYPSTFHLIEWVLDVTKENLLAGAVLLDALEWFSQVLRWILPERLSRFPDPQEKKQWTECAGVYCVEFEVPDGWEFSTKGIVHPAGFRGVAVVGRCHLSQNVHHVDDGFGRLVGLAERGVEMAVGFDIPCDYHPSVRIEQDGFHIDEPDSTHCYGVSIPYAFVLRAFRRPLDRKAPLTFIPRPIDEQVVELAMQSVARIQEKATANEAAIS